MTWLPAKCVYRKPYQTVEGRLSAAVAACLFSSTTIKVRISINLAAVVYGRLRDISFSHSWIVPKWLGDNNPFEIRRNNISIIYFSYNFLEDYTPTSISLSHELPLLSFISVKRRVMCRLFNITMKYVLFNVLFKKIRFSKHTYSNSTDHRAMTDRLSAHAIIIVR